METPNQDTDNQALLKKLEKEGEEKARVLLKSPLSTKEASDSLVNIISSGAQEFKAKTGRHMTYSEMREAYG